MAKKKTARSSNLKGKDAPIAEGLRHLGFTEYEIRVYLGILRHPLSRIPEIARWSGVPQPKVYATVKRLIERGLCESHLGPVNTYSAMPPKTGFAPLLATLKSRHTDAGEIIRSLQKEHVTPSDPLGPREGRIKVFHGKQATVRNMRFLLSRVEKSVYVVAKLPLIVTDDDELIEQALKRGVKVRILVEVPKDFDFGEEPTIQRQLALGCESRRMDKVPMRFGVFDEKITILPMHDDVGEGKGFKMLEVRNESLAEGLTQIFDGYWATARRLASAGGRR